MLLLSVYVAAPWAHKNYAAAVAKTLQTNGHAVVSTWHDEPEGADDNLSQSDLAHRAFLDLEELSDANAMFLLNLEKSEGKAVEQGFAIRSGIPIIGIGCGENNIFQNLPMYTFVETIEEGIHELELLLIGQRMKELELTQPFIS